MANATTNLSSSAIETALTSLQNNLQFSSSGLYIDLFGQLSNSKYYEQNNPDLPPDARYFITDISSTTLNVIDSLLGATATFTTSSDFLSGATVSITSSTYRLNGTTITIRPEPGFSTIDENFFTYTFVDDAAPSSRLVVQVANSVATQVTLINGGLTGTITGGFDTSGAGFMTSLTLTSTNNYLNLTNGTAFFEATGFNLPVPAQSLIDRNSFIGAFRGDDAVVSTSRDGRPIDLLGFAGNDNLTGGAGLDTLFGGQGDDTFVISSSQNAIVEFSGEGTDTVLSRVTYTLPDNVENLTLTQGEFGVPFNSNGTGNSLDNYIVGNDGDNILFGLDGNDTLEGSNGDDILDGGVGADNLEGGSQSDVYIIDNIGDRVTEEGSSLGGLLDEVQSSITFNLAEQASRDIFGYGIEKISLLGSQNIDVFGAGQLSITINGNSGNNLLVGGTGSDFIFGGAGNDTLQGGNIVTESGGSGFEFGGSTRNAFYIDQLAGGAGNDTYITPLERLKNLLTDVTTSVVTSSVIVEGINQGTDTVILSNTIADAGLTTLTLGANLENFDASLTGLTKLNLFGNNLANQVSGNDTDNILDGKAGADVMMGGLGDDIYYVDNALDLLTESVDEGTDTVISSISFDLSLRGANVENLTLSNGLLNGGTTALNGTGNNLDNTITGNAGANILNGGLGADTLIGGAGNDTYVVDIEGDVVVETNAGGIDLVRSAVSFNLGTSGANVENLILTGTTSINGRGNALNNIILGNAGNNILDGTIGTDSLIGGAGDDLYIVDLIQTGTLTFPATLRVALQDKITEALNTGTDTLTLRGNSFIHNIVTTLTLGANLENFDASGTGLTNLNLTGNTLNNIITGNDAANFLSGGAGIDVLNGGAGNDILDGGLGLDTLVGGTGDDTYLVDIVASGFTPNLTAILQDAIIEENDTTDGVDTLRLRGNVVIPAVTVASNIVLADSLANIENLDASLTGTSKLNLTGNGADNIMIGNSAINTLNGGLGNDTLDGKAGADIMVGGLGNDTYIVDNLNDQITELSDEGTDTVISSISFDLNIKGANVENLTLSNGTVNGGTTALNGTGNDLNNIITGNAGANILNGGLGADTLIGGLGNDTYIVDNANDVVIEALNAGTDTIRSAISFDMTLNGANIENLTLTDGTPNGGISNINGFGNALNNVITGNAGDNILDGIGGKDTLIGGLGNDEYVVDLIQTGTSTSTFRVALEDTVKEAANAGIDFLKLIGDFEHQNATTLTLGANLENLDAQFTGTTKLNLTGNTLNNVLTGNDADNILLGAAGNDELVGGAGNDMLDGGIGADVLTGGAGDDTYVVDIIPTLTNVAPIVINGVTLQDSIDEDNGTADGMDTLKLRGSVVIPTATAATNIALTDALASVENLDISLTGSTRLNLTGNDADNILIGNAAINTLNGGLGNDTLDGKAGADINEGGLGDDTYVVDNLNDQITELVGEGEDTVISSISFDLNIKGANIENLILSNGTINGGTTALNGTGNALNNTITGNAGANILNGGLGADRLVGGLGNDTLNGGDGDDTLLGGIGNDSLTGGIGADVFQWSLADKGIKGSPSVDRVLDFNYDQNDVLNLRDLIPDASAENIDNYLDVITTTVSGVTSTEIRISGSGEFTNGSYTLAKESNHITLLGVNLYAEAGIANNNDSALLQTLLTQNKVVVD